MSDTQKNDVILDILNRAVKYSNGVQGAIIAITDGVNAIASAINARRVTVAEAVDALEAQTEKTDDTILGNIAKTRAAMGLPPRE